MTPETIDLDGSIVEISAAIDPRTGERLIAIDRELLSDKAQAWAFEHAGATGEDVTDGLVEIYNDPRNWMGPDDSGLPARHQHSVLRRRRGLEHHWTSRVA